MPETNISCNCPWMGCPTHPHALCQGNANHMNCDNPECHNSHWLGDCTLGEGIHLCVACAHSIIEIFTDDVPALMQQFQPFMPMWLRPLNQFVKNSYKDKIKHGTGWQLPYMDACGVLGLAVVTQELDKESKIPITMLLELHRLQVVVTDLIHAFNPQATDTLGVQEEV